MPSTMNRSARDKINNKKERKKKFNYRPNEPNKYLQNILPKSNRKLILLKFTQNILQERLLVHKASLKQVIIWDQQLA